MNTPEMSPKSEGINYEAALDAARENRDALRQQSTKSMQEIDAAEEAYYRAYYMRNMHNNGLPDEKIAELIDGVVAREKAEYEDARHRDFKENPI